MPHNTGGRIVTTDYCDIPSPYVQMERTFNQHWPKAHFCTTLKQLELGQDFWPMTWPNPVAFDPVTRPNSVVQRCEKNPRQRLDSSISQSLLLLLLLLLLRPFNGLFSRTTWVSQHQKGKPFWILLEQETIRWQSHQLYRMQIICTLLQTDNHASTSPLSFYRPDALPATQPTASKHWRH